MNVFSDLEPLKPTRPSKATPRELPYVNVANWPTFQTLVGVMTILGWFAVIGSIGLFWFLVAAGAILKAGG